MVTDMQCNYCCTVWAMPGCQRHCATGSCHACTGMLQRWCCKCSRPRTAISVRKGVIAATTLAVTATLTGTCKPGCPRCCKLKVSGERVPLRKRHCMSAAQLIAAASVTVSKHAGLLTLPVLELLLQLICEMQLLRLQLFLSQT